MKALGDPIIIQHRFTWSCQDNALICTSRHLVLTSQKSNCRFCDFDLS